MFKLSQRGLAHILLLLAGFGILGFILLSSSADFKSGVFSNLFQKQTSEARGNRQSLNPNNFTTEITNKYFTLEPGKKMVYEKQTADGLERVEILVTDETKKLMGVDTLLFRDTVWLDDQLHEDTKDYFAQDKDGNVWYFGEEVDNYENGVVANHDGSWLSGKDGARPGIYILANPKVGDSYKQENYPGVAEDTVDVLSINETVTVPFGTFKNCVKTYDYTPLNPDSREHKWHCPGVGALVYVVDLVTNEKLELIDVTTVGEDEEENDGGSKRKNR